MQYSSNCKITIKYNVVDEGSLICMICTKVNVSQHYKFRRDVLQYVYLRNQDSEEFILNIHFYECGLRCYQTQFPKKTVIKRATGFHSC